MAVIDLAYQDLNRTTGIDLTDTGSLSVANQYFVLNDGNVFLHFKKSGAGACTVTVVTPATVSGGLAVADPTYTVPATTGDVMVGPFPPETFNDPTTGKLQFTLSEITGLTVAVARLPR